MLFLNAGKASMPGVARIDGLIPAGTLLRGSLEFSGTLWIEAEIHGNVRSKPDATSTLIIGPQAKVFGSVEAEHVVIQGAVTGRITSYQTLVFEHGSLVIAEEILHCGLTIRNGARVEGALLSSSRLPQDSVTKSQANVQVLRTEPHQDSRRADGVGCHSSISSV